MRLRKISEILFAMYGVLTALDKLDRLLKDERDYRLNKELKRNIRRGKVSNDYEWLMFETKDAAFCFLDRIRDDIDMFGSISVGEIYKMHRLPYEPVDFTIGYDVLYVSSVKIRKHQGNYRLILPKPKCLI